MALIWANDNLFWGCFLTTILLRIFATTAPYHLSSVPPFPASPLRTYLEALENEYIRNSRASLIKTKTLDEIRY